MTEIKKIFSFKEFRNVRVLVICALMTALNVVLSLFEIPLFGNQMMIGFQFVAVAIIGYMYGAMPAMIVGGVGDIIGAFLFPKGAFFIGFTLNAMMQGFIFGIFFYKKQITIPRIMAALLASTIIVSLIMTPTWIGILFSSNQWITRGIYVKAITKYPVDVLITYIFLSSLNMAKKLKK
ncbi:folate family ECF transporter S component [Miniphocaeibacter massiliensis]|uniref:folate family ECF transporter S component n=1 Tax=Miniphocaeibacter massiliensis TaxID=2041841 RepID=UPI000C071D89|nr:folate family ECF transporter S component [Miniphocaeibacter massiliensis]